MIKKLAFFTFVLLAVSLLLAACRPAATPTEAPPAAQPTEAPAVEEPTEAPAVEEPTEAPVMEEKVQLRWFVGLGAGSDEPTFAAQEAFVEEFNASQDKIELILEIIDNDVAYDTLATQIAAGNAPDIVGPVGIRGRDSFKGAWLDLQPLIDSTNYDLTAFDEGMVQFYNDIEEGQLGLPFAIFPSFIMYNQELFDEVGLAYPPQEYGALYEGETWDYDAVADIATLLTVDGNGNDATSPDFDPEDIVQFGFAFQWTDARGVGTQFGPGSLVDANGDAQIPPAWVDAWKWRYDAMWESHFHPNGPYTGSDLFPGTNLFESGNIAMVHIHLWYVACCVANLDAGWDFAVVPEYNGVTTAKMHADTFGILKASEHPEEAFEVLTYMLSAEHAPDLLAIYGGMPARLSLQDTYFDETWPDLDVNWEVVKAGMAFSDNPNHESYMPSFQETNDKYNEYFAKWDENPGLDLDAEIAALQADLQLIFDAAKE